MKTMIIAILTLMSINTFAANGKVSLRCESGIGTGGPQILKLEGQILDFRHGKTLSLQEKSKLSLKMFDGEKMVAIRANEFSVSLSMHQYPNIVIKLLNNDDIKYQIYNAGGPGEHIINVIGKSFFLRNDKEIDGGLCFGTFPVSFSL